MRWALIFATVFAISTTGTTFAAAVDPRINVTSDPKTVCEPRGYCPWPSVPGLIFTYDQEIDGDVVVWRYVGFKGAVPVGLVGLPPWLRKVPTSYGFDLVGRPQPGKIRVEQFYEGVHAPTLDRDYTFIPR